MFSDKQIVKDLVSLSSEIVSKKTQVTMQLRYHSEIYKIILILINHYIYSFGKEYVNGWTHSNQQSLDNFLNMGHVEVPLLETLKKLDMTSRDKYLIDFANDENRTNMRLRTRVKDIRSQISTLMEEKNSSSLKPTLIRAKIIDQTIAKLNTELSECYIKLGIAFGYKALNVDDEAKKNYLKKSKLAYDIKSSQRIN
jgi:flagellar basal body-associated protein FliL